MVKKNVTFFKIGPVRAFVAVGLWLFLLLLLQLRCKACCRRTLAFPRFSCSNSCPDAQTKKSKAASTKKKQKQTQTQTKKMSRPVPTTALLKGTLTFSAPLIITTLYHQPYLTTFGILLQYFLALRTYNPLKNSSTINQSLETSAIRTLVTTSTTNRTTRLLLGTVHVLAALSLASRSQINFNNKIFAAARGETARGETTGGEITTTTTTTNSATTTTTSKSSLMVQIQKEVRFAARWGWQVLTMGGTLMLTTTAAIWLSSGYYGQ